MIIILKTSKKAQSPSKRIETKMQAYAKKELKQITTTDQVVTHITLLYAQIIINYKYVYAVNAARIVMMNVSSYL